MNAEKNSEWSEDKVLTFLDAYHVEESIWNPKHPDHKDRKKVNDAWKRLSALMRKNVKELKNKKEILMSTFRRHLRKKLDTIQAGAGPADVYKPAWFAYDRMESFLFSVYKRAVKNNIEPEEPETFWQETSAIDYAEPSTSSYAPTPVVSLRHPDTDVEYPAERHMRQIKRPPPQEEDDCDLYSKLLAKKLRELPPDERKLFMYDIDTLFINRIKERLATRQSTVSAECCDATEAPDEKFVICQMKTSNDY